MTRTERRRDLLQKPYLFEGELLNVKNPNYRCGILDTKIGRDYFKSKRWYFHQLFLKSLGLQEPDDSIKSDGNGNMTDLEGNIVTENVK